MDDLANATNNCTNSTDVDTGSVPATLYRQIMGTIIFAIVWPFVVLDMKWFPLGRPAAALVGGTLMVIFVVVPQDEVFLVLGDTGNLQTICLLVGMMLLSYYYDREGLLRIIALWIFGKNRPFKHILWKICVLSAILSAIITNDATCLVITPLLLKEHAKQHRPRKELPPLLLGIATSANIGSAATFFGNPQNAFIAANSNDEVSLLTFFATSLPAAVIGMFLSVALLYLMYYQTVREKGTVTKEVAQDENSAENTGENYEPISEEYDREDLVTSLSVSREKLALRRDQSENPFLSSQIAQERERMYQATSKSSFQMQGPFDQLPSKHSSLPARFRSYRSPVSLELTSNQADPHPGDDIQLLSYRRHHDPHSQKMTPFSNAVEQTEENEAEDEGDVVETKRIRDREWRSKLFLVWLAVITIIVVGLLAVPPLPHYKFNLGLVPLGAGILTMLADTILNRKYAYDAMTKIDWPVILLFMGLFVWLRGFENTSFPDHIFNKILPFMNLSQVQGVLLFTVFVVIGSNILSNVPLVILIVDQLCNFHCNDGNCPVRLTGVLLAWVSTIAGNFTLIGSVANLIVAEKARSSADYKLTFWEYLKFGFVSTLVVLFAGLPVVYFTGKYVDI